MSIINFLKNIFQNGSFRCVLLILIILGSAYFTLYKFITPKDDWFTCHQDNECTVKAACSYKPINIDFLSRATNFTKLFEPVFSTKCINRENLQPRQAFCKLSICEYYENSKYEDWIICEKNSDCVAIYANCGHKMAVNKRFQSAAQDSFKRFKAYRDCMEVPKGDFHISCENSQCNGEYR